MNLSLFTSAQLKTALERAERQFADAADRGFLSAATAEHEVAVRIRAELDARADKA